MGPGTRTLSIGQISHDVEELLQAKAKAGYSPKTMRKIIVLLNVIFHLAVDNDLITRSPVRDRHKPVCHKADKPAWTPEQIRGILSWFAWSIVAC